MSTYKNGKIPDHLLIRRGDFLLTAGTWAKFDDLVERVKNRTGVTLRISTGSTVATRGAGAFRTYTMQVLVKAYWTVRGKSRMAAYPGTSSHGGEYKGADALAIDITNYGQVPLHVFFEEGRNAGFQMGYFDGKNGKPYEPWHIIDRNPYRKVPSTAGGNAKPIIIPAVPEEEDEPMKYGQIHTTRPDGKMLRRALYAPGTAYFAYWDANDAGLANALARQFETGSSQEVSYGVFEAFQKAAAACAG